MLKKLLKVVCCGVCLCLWYFYPFHPTSLKMATADIRSGYDIMATSAMPFFKKNGVNLSIKNTEGSVENAQLLGDLHGDVDAAFIQGGSIAIEAGNNFYSLGSVSYEPVWVFYRKNLRKNIRLLKGIVNFKVGVGPIGGGTHALVGKLLELDGIAITNSRNFVVDTYQNNFENFKKGRLDVLIEVTTVHDEHIRALMSDPNVELLEFARAPAYEKILPFIEEVTLPIASIDFERSIPPKDVPLISTTTSLVVRRDMDDALQLLLIYGARDEIRRSQNLFFTPRNTFPSYVDPTIDESPIAIEFYEKHPINFFNLSSFWLAYWLNKIWIWLVGISAVVSLLGPTKRLLKWASSVDCLK
jgi:TRAP-type uncharacterized transport system substrate-binding protein